MVGTNLLTGSLHESPSWPPTPPTNFVSLFFHRLDGDPPPLPPAPVWVSPLKVSLFPCWVDSDFQSHISLLEYPLSRNRNIILFFHCLARTTTPSPSGFRTLSLKNHFSLSSRTVTPPPRNNRYFLSNVEPWWPPSPHTYLFIVFFFSLAGLWPLLIVSCEQYRAVMTIFILETPMIFC